MSAAWIVFAVLHAIGEGCASGKPTNAGDSWKVAAIVVLDLHST